MKGVIRLAVSAYIVLICLILINLFTSPAGIISYVELEEYKETIEANIAELSIINSDLIMDSNKLMQQTDEIKVQARALGWVEPNEGLIVVKGYKKLNSGYSMGRLLSHDRGTIVKNHNSLLISILIGLSFYVFTGFFKREPVLKNY